MTKVGGEVHVQIGTDFKEPLVMRWAVSKDHAREWAVHFSISSTTINEYPWSIYILGGDF